MAMPRSVMNKYLAGESSLVQVSQGIRRRDVQTREKRRAFWQDERAGEDVGR